MTTSIGGASQVLDDGAVAAFVAEQISALDLDGRSLCLVIPDATRQCPLLPLLLGASTAPPRRVRSCTAVVALGTHADLRPGSDGTGRHRGPDGGEPRVVGRRHLRDGGHPRFRPGRRARMGSSSRRSTSASTDWSWRATSPSSWVRFSPTRSSASRGQQIPLSRALGPGAHRRHPLARRLISSSEIIGTLGITPVRALVEAAAALVPGERHALCVVVDDRTGGLHSATFGDPLHAWSAAAEVAAATHVRYRTRRSTGWSAHRSPLRRSVDRGQGLLQGRADRGRRRRGDPLRAAHHRDRPHASRSARHRVPLPRLLPRPVAPLPRPPALAHSTRVYGAGTYDPVTGEHPRVPANVGHRHP